MLRKGERWLIPARMKAIAQDRYGDAHVLEYREVERPEPGPGQLLVRMHAAGVDAGEWHIMTGRPLLVRLFFGLRRPKPAVRGRDVAGVVANVGEGVRDFAVGDAVFGHGSGSYAEFAILDAKQACPKPEALSFEEAAALPESAITARDALHAAGELAPGAQVLVTGAGGGVGSFVVQLAKAAGHEVTGVCSGAKAELVRGLGADRVVDYTREDFTCEDARYDLIVDLAGRRRVRDLRRVLDPEGQLVLMGAEGGGPLTGGLHRQILAALGSKLRKQKVHAPISMERTRADLEELVALVEAGKLRVHVSHVYPLEDAAHALEQFAEGHTAGKLVIG
jgi:NADPH:quinone reductase-like Zn-dependent oxidoreductase